MNLPHFKFHQRDLAIQDTGSLTHEELRSLTTSVFQAWTNATPKGSDPSDSTDLRADMRKRTEGLGDAEVWELRFVRSDHDTSVASFILRAHLGEANMTNAAREREIVRLLNSTASECFSTEILDGFSDAPHVVIYRHAADQIDGEAVTLLQALKAAFAEKDTAAIGDIAARLRELLSGAVHAFGRISADGSTRSGSEYYNQLRNRLLPDVILDARNRTLTVDPSGSINISTADGSSPPVSLSRISNYDAMAFARRLESGTLNASWVQLNDVWYVGRSRRNTNCLQLRAGSTRLWLRVDSSDLTNLQDSRPYSIRFHVKDHVASTPREVLREAGFAEASYVSDADLAAMCGRVRQLVLVPIHTDLHAQNVVYSPARLKIVDVGSIDRDLAVTAAARLETSLWYDIIDSLPLEKDEIAGLLLALDTPGSAGVLDPGPITSSAYELLSSVRSAVRNAATSATDADAEALSYVTQVLLHQRYFLESREGSIGIPFRMFAEHTVHNLRRLFQPSLDAVVPGADNVIEPARSARPGENSLGDLWELALQSPRTDIVDARARRILEAFASADPPLFHAALTELQKAVYDAWENDRCFQSNRHVIIAGPTSCGKSKLAEMFLVGPAVWNKRRTCTLYIAPTRALAQAKYRELRELFLSAPEFQKEIVISTGENTDDDWRITHGRFTIASLVYEKANILFSQNSKLLERVACVVIDEMHMLMDLERGPTLEIATLKLLLERRRLDFQESRDPARELLRVVAISTEDRPDPALVSLLSSHAPDQPTRRAEPLIYHGYLRPVAVEHVLVLAGQAGDSSTQVPIVEFTSAQERQLSRERLQELDVRLDAAWQSPEMCALRESRKDPKRELRTQLIELLIDKLTRQPLGYRALVFVPGRAEVENLAQRLRNQVRERRTFGTEEESPHHDVFNRLKIESDSVEDQRTADIVRKCAAFGIMIHHADVDRKLRTAIEAVCATQAATTPSQVLFATETLSYGVNLAVTDVFLLGTTFYAQTRFREARSEPLSICAFHNMAGRAGRLGRRGKFKSHVYVLVPFDERPLGVLERYYTKVLPVTSQLYVEDDKQKQYRIEDNWFTRSLSVDSDPCMKYRGLGAMDFSYPFVRSVLDALRHLNIATSGGASDAKRPAKFDDLLEVFGTSLYAAQRLSRPAGHEEAALFKCAVLRVLDDCASPHLDLVKIDEGRTRRRYTITARGEAIIDTGTELHTVEPMLRFVSWLHKTWAKHNPGVSFPTDLYVLAIVTQSEISRQFVRYTPECRGEESDRGWNAQLAEVNREAVLRQLAVALAHMKVPEPEHLAFEIRAFLDDFEPTRNTKAAYAGGATDGVLRLFNGLVAWINGEERSRVEDKIEVVEASDALRTKMQGLRQFTDQVSWKTLFLAKMLASATPGPMFGPDDERMLHLLVSRLRLGCTPEAVPLFWPHSSDFRRAQAVALLEAGMTPNRLICTAEPYAVVSPHVNISSDKLEKLCRDLEKLAIKEFSELSEEMTAVEAKDERREGIHRLWRNLSHVFPDTVTQFRKQTGAAVDVDGFIRDGIRTVTEAESGTRTLGPRGRTLDRLFRIRVEIPEEGSGIFLVAEQAIEDSRDPERHTFTTQISMKAVGVQMSRTWQCRSQDSRWIDFTEFLQSEASTVNLLLIPFPWLPSFDAIPAAVREALKARQATMRGHTLFVSGAAFTTIVTCIARDFFTGEVLTRSITATDGAPRFVGMKSIQPLVDTAPNPLPPTIREKVIRHFEVEPFGLQESLRL